MATYPIGDCTAITCANRLRKNATHKCDRLNTCLIILCQAPVKSSIFNERLSLFHCIQKSGASDAGFYDEVVVVNGFSFQRMFKDLTCFIPYHNILSCIVYVREYRVTIWYKHPQVFQYHWSDLHHVHGFRIKFGISYLI